MLFFVVQNDRRERLVKRSRDITIGSKRLIFLLHRSVPPLASLFQLQLMVCLFDACFMHGLCCYLRIWDSNKDEIKAQATPPLEKIKEDIRAIQAELKDHAYWKYEPAFTPGLQGIGDC